ncbi:hypothetical protein [Paraburkholderia caffeinilytica]|uniref:hypothetical protein n=1 Tax=Paraburkholderia caffeinilytica TaxID=1761016 RepID=UPI0038B8D4AF
MRAWGRTYNKDGTYQWVAASTQANGLNDAFYITALAQCLKLNLGESPIYANSGIPQIQTIATQTFPDFYMFRIQQQYAQYFASLTISRVPGTIPPQYNVRAVTHSGAIISQNIPT